MKYKAIIWELDGTLLKEHHTNSEETKETIRKVVNSGVKFIIATGRHQQCCLHFESDTVIRSWTYASCVCHYTATVQKSKTILHLFSLQWKQPFSGWHRTLNK